MSFSHALAALKGGECVARAGWNGKGMFIWLEKGSYDVPPAGDVPGTISGVPISLFDQGDNGTVTRMPHLCMRAGDGSTVTGWNASQSDTLTHDWTIVVTD
ncbi:hypothetical protein D9M68_953150 [compost metagenome]